MDFSTIFSADNAVFSGGFGLAVVAIGAQTARVGANVAIRILRRNWLTSLEVTSKDKSYPWVLQWLSSRGGRTQHLSVETALKTGVCNNSTSFQLVPGPGQHLMMYKNKFIFVQRVREQQMVDLNTGKPWEKVLLTSIGRNTEIFDNLLLEAFEMAAKQEEGKTVVYTNWGSEWRQFGQPRKKRTIDSVVLDKGVSEGIVHDVNEWIGSAQWYSDRGIPYRRGYLLHGPPGSGKSSFITALAGKLGYNICILNLSERGLTDDRLALALSTVPANSVVLLEDVDAAFPSRDETSQIASSYAHSEVTFSGLLNVLDGVASSEERLIFMTTNHVHRLDPALIRPGRVDYVQLIDNATDFQITKLFTKFFEGASSEDASEFVKRLRAVMPTMSMALLQGYLLRHKNSQQDALSSVATLLSGEYTVAHHVQTTSKRTDIVNGRRKVRPLTAAEVDKMYFNPQEGWDSNIRS